MDLPSYIWLFLIFAVVAFAALFILAAYSLVRLRKLGQSVADAGKEMSEGIKGGQIEALKHAQEQMDSLGMSTTDYYLLRRLHLYRTNLRVERERAEHILQRLLQHIEDCDSRDLFVVDSMTPLLFQFDERYVLSFLARCKDLADMGRTIMVTLHSYAIHESLRLRAGSIVDAHLRLRIEELGKQLVRTLEVTKIRGAVKTADNSVSFTVEPGLGLKSVPISKTKA